MGRWKKSNELKSGKRYRPKTSRAAASFILLLARLITQAELRSQLYCAPKVSRFYPGSIDCLPPGAFKNRGFLITSNDNRCSGQLDISQPQILTLLPRLYPLESVVERLESGIAFTYIV